MTLLQNMQNGLRRAGNVGLVLIPAFIFVLVIIVAVLLALDKDPTLAAQKFLDGALGTDARRADVIMTALPILLCASGLLLTYTAGLWNIGVEGQVTMGAVFASFLARGVTLDQTSLPILFAEIALAAFGGALWALLAAVLKTRGKVNEIFGGVALNFIAQNILIYLVSGPWQAPGNSPTTAPFAEGALFPRAARLRLSPLAIGITVIAYLAVFIVLSGTRWGLQLRAMGRSEKSAFLLGVRTERNVLLSMAVCGALAGIAGATQTLFTRGRLVTGISGGVGFLGVLIVLLVMVRAAWVPLVTLFFAIVPVGSQKLDVAMNLDSAIGNVFQSALVFGVLLTNGLRARFASRRGKVS